MDGNGTNPAGLTIHDLPLEMVHEILKWINFRNQPKAQSVCRLWHAIVDEWIGGLVTSSTPPKIIHPDNPSQTKAGLELISDIGVKCLIIKPLNGNLLEHPPSPLPSFKRPYLLKYLVLFGKIHPDLFRSLVKDTVNLAVFQVSLPALAHIRSEDLKHLNFPKLVRLRIAGLSRNLEEKLAGLPNLRRLLEDNPFSRLSHLAVEIPLPSSHDLEMMMLLVQFLQGHPNVRELAVRLEFPTEFQPAPVDPSELMKVLTSIRESKCGHSLKGLKLEGWNLSEAFPQLELLRELAIQPNHLVDLSLKIGHLSNELIQTLVSRNGSTLKRLFMFNFMDPLIVEEVETDLNIFSGLESILQLQLSGKQKVKGVKHLPPTVESLALSGAMRSDELDHLLFNVPKLFRIILTNVGGNGGEGQEDDEEGYGVRLESLRKFVETRKVKQFVLFVGPSDRAQFPQERIPNGDPVNPLELTVDWGQYVNWELNEDGYYVNADRLPV